MLDGRDRFVRLLTLEMTAQTCEARRGKARLRGDMPKHSFRKKLCQTRHVNDTWAAVERIVALEMTLSHTRG